MSLQHELGLPNPILHPGHEALLSIVMTAATLTKEGDRLLRPFGITDSQFNVLMLLKYQTDAGEINQTRLGRMLLVNRSNVTGLIDRMEQAGWVRRRADPIDRRVKMVALTDEGNDLVSRAEKVYFHRMEEVLGELPATSLAQLVRLLDRLRQRLRQVS